jgi:hypothetical protein
VTPRRSRRRAVWFPAVAFALAAAVAVVGCGEDDTPEGFSDETRVAMLSGCAEKDADDDLVEVCACAYEQMEEDLGFDEFASLDGRLADGDDRLPTEVVEIIRGCIRTVSASRG